MSSMVRVIILQWVSGAMQWGYSHKDIWGCFGSPFSQEISQYMGPIFYKNIPNHGPPFPSFSGVYHIIWTPENCEKWTSILRKILNWPLKMGTGFEAPVAHPSSNQIGVHHPPTGSSCERTLYLSLNKEVQILKSGKKGGKKPHTHTHLRNQ